jgi:hypothetical protein
LGYRKPATGPGSWIARLIRGGARDEHRLGQADDAGAAPEALPYAAAVSAAIEWAGRKIATHAPADAEVQAPITLRAAVLAYVEDRKARNQRHGRDAETRLGKHLLPAGKLPGKPLAALTERDLSGWVRGLSGLAPATVDRLLNDAKAALNHAWGQHHRALPAGWRDTVARGLKRAGASAGKGTASHHRLSLTDADVRRVVEAAFTVDPDGDFGRLVALLAATGGRLSQVARLRAMRDSG